LEWNMLVGGQGRGPQYFTGPRNPQVCKIGR